MPQDKRLIVTKAVLFKLKRLCNGDDEVASGEGIFLEFMLPSVVLAQVPELQSDTLFALPHRVYPRNGRSTCLIVPKQISFDCTKVNKRHGYYDAVVTAEAICKRGDTEAAKRAARVANTFSHFVVDARIVGKMPAAIADKVRRGGLTSSSASLGSNKGSGLCPSAALTPLTGLDEGESMTFRLSQGAMTGMLRNKLIPSVGGAASGSGSSGFAAGQLLFRVGHGGMTAGEICENAKHFVLALKKDYPTVWKYIHDFKLTSNKTDSIRFMEVQLQK